MSIPVPNPDLAIQEVDDGLLLLKDDGSYIVVNRTAYLIWQYIGKSENLEALAENVCRRLGIDVTEVVLDDIERFIKELLDRSFLVERS